MQMDKAGYLQRIHDTYTVLDVDNTTFPKVYCNKVGLTVQPEMEVLAV